MFTSKTELPNRVVGTLLGLLLATTVGCGGDEKANGDGGSGGGGPTEPLALTPPMGFNNWNAFGCDVNEALIKETADFFVSSGLKDAGYQYVNIDDCWSLKNRDSDGRLVPDPIKFPSGIDGVADYVHGLGLKLGIYGDAGTQTCAGYPGSLGHEDIDARTWAEWGVDYVKYDNCYNQSDGSRQDYVERYTAMRDALRKTRRPIVYSICEWGTSQPWEWARDVGQLWRTTGDISDNWSSLKSIISINAPLYAYAGPGHWNDPDMLEVGNAGLTLTEARTHMSLWAMMAAPLLIGTDLRVASDETLEILMNPELIAIDQDPLGKQGSLVQSGPGMLVLDKELSSGEHAVVLYNSTDEIARVDVEATALDLPGSDAYRLVEAWSGAALKSGPTIAADVPPHGAVVYRASPTAVDEPLPPAVALGATLNTLIAGLEEGATLTTRVENLGLDEAEIIEVSVTAPDGWTITAVGENTNEALPSGESFETEWRVEVPADATSGRQTIALSVTYGASDASDTVTVKNEVIPVVVTAPPEGASPLATIVPVSAVNALGPVEIDMSNGGSNEADGNLLTIEGTTYTRGIGTQSPSEITYYLGGDCSAFTAEVGIDDEVSGSASATFSVYADDELVAQSSLLTDSDPAESVSADITGATWLKLVAEPGSGSSGSRADWALPVVVCGDSTEPTMPELTLFSFETGTDDFTIANSGPGGTVSEGAPFHTDGEQGLEVVAPADGNWFGRSLGEPVDLSSYSTLKVDVKTGAQGTAGELAIQLGGAWCQGGLWSWTNPNHTGTIRRELSDLACPAGTTRDLTSVTAIWVYLKDGTFQIDNVRAE